MSGCEEEQWAAARPAVLHMLRWGMLTDELRVALGLLLEIFARIELRRVNMQA